jgi:hypothetical protein
MCSLVNDDTISMVLEITLALGHMKLKKYQLLLEQQFRLIIMLGTKE